MSRSRVRKIGETVMETYLDVGSEDRGDAQSQQGKS